MFVMHSQIIITTIDTIKDFADRYGFAIELVEDFRERKVDSGWIDDFTAFSKRQWSDFTYKLPGGESLHEVQVRNIRALQEVLKNIRERMWSLAVTGRL